MPSPLIIAHRGAAAERPENTLAAFRRAVELGVDGVELDVHRTADGVLVVHHDFVPREAPPALAGRPIHTLTVADLATVRFRGEAIPTLSEVIATIGGRATIFCELKGPGTAQPAAALLAPLGDRAAVHAFDHRQVALARAAMPQLRRGVLEVSYRLDPMEGVRSVDAHDIWPEASSIDQALVDAAHRDGVRVIAWTVDVPEEAQRLVALGVAALCTNDPAAIRRAIGG